MSDEPERNLAPDGLSLRWPKDTYRGEEVARFDHRGKSYAIRRMTADEVKRSAHREPNIVVVDADGEALTHWIPADFCSRHAGELADEARLLAHAGRVAARLGGQTTEQKEPSLADEVADELTAWESDLYDLVTHVFRLHVQQEDFGEGSAYVRLPELATSVMETVALEYDDPLGDGERRAMADAASWARRAAETAAELARAQKGAERVEAMLRKVRDILASHGARWKWTVGDIDAALAAASDEEEPSEQDVDAFMEAIGYPEPGEAATPGTTASRSTKEGVDD